MLELIKSLKIMLSRRQKFQFIGVNLLISFQGLLETVAVLLVYPFMYVLMGTEDVSSNKWMGKLWKLFDCRTTNDFLVILSILLIVMFILKNVVAVGVRWVQYDWMGRLSQYQANTIYSNYFKREYSFFLNSDTADIVRSVTDDINKVYEDLKALFDLIQKIIITLFLFVALVVINPGLTIAGGVALGFTLLILNRIVSTQNLKYGNISTETLTNQISWTNQSMGLIKNILINRKSNFYVDKFKKYSKELYNNLTRFEVISEVPGKFVESFCMSLIFLYVIFLLKSNSGIESLVVQFAVFAIAVIKILPSIVGISGSINRAKYYTVALENVLSNLQAVKKDEENNQKNDLKSFGDEIRLNHIFFKYADSDKILYSDANLVIEAGTSVAFIGKTGSGKTTLADIILGLHIPQAGNVTVDGKDIFLNKDAWGAKIGYIPQNIYLRNGTIAENIAFGEKDIDVKQVKKCLDEASMDEYVDTLPKGIETEIGENGVKLSGGQRQRIGIARALYSNPEFLVMDEATSALDAETEAAITESIRKLSHKVTLLIIAHRINTIIDCDHIYRVEDGNIEEVKDRAALLAQSQSGK